MFATIYLPNFYLQAATRHQPELRAKPVGLIEEQERKPLIVQLNEAGETVGIRKGMTPSQALARCLSVVIKARAYMQEKSIQEILLHCVFSLSPFVEATAPGVCTVQFTDNRDLKIRLKGFQSRQAGSHQDRVTNGPQPHQQNAAYGRPIEPTRPLFLMGCGSHEK